MLRRILGHEDCKNKSSLHKREGYVVERSGDLILLENRVYKRNIIFFLLPPAVTTPAQRTKVPPVHHSSPTTQITHHPRVSRASSVVGDKPPTFLPSTTASKISALEKLLKPRTASYNHHTRLHRQR